MMMFTNGYKLANFILFVRFTLFCLLVNLQVSCSQFVLTKCTVMRLPKSTCFIRCEAARGLIKLGLVSVGGLGLVTGSRCGKDVLNAGGW